MLGKYTLFEFFWIFKSLTYIINSWEFKLFYYAISENSLKLKSILFDKI